MRIIGFDVRALRKLCRKIRTLVSIPIPNGAKMPRFAGGNYAKLPSKKIL